MNLNTFIICIAAVSLFAVPALAENSIATINGGVYSWDTFELLENAVVEVNSTPSQSMVAKYGVYSFELEPGDYLITAGYYRNSTLIYSAEESIKVKGEGSYVVDLLLLPVYSKELMEGSELKESAAEALEDTENSSIVIQNISNNPYAVNNSDADENDSNVIISETKGSIPLTGYYLAAALMLSLLLAGGYKFQKHKSKDKNEPGNNKLQKIELVTNRSEKYMQEKSQPLKEKTGTESEKPSVPVTVPGFSAQSPYENIEQKTRPEFSIELAETRLSQKSGFEVRKEENIEENTEKQIILEPGSAGLEEKSEKDKEISPEEPSRVPESPKVSKQKTTILPKKNLPLPADLQEIMDIIRGQGGRITQKDLRSKLKYSEGKVSLMLADLERRELIEKFKRGRGNVIILRDEER